MSNAAVKHGRTWVYYASWMLTALPALALLLSAAMKLTANPHLVSDFTGKFGFSSADTLVPLGIVEMLVTVLYLVPRTTYLGAVLATGYLGGAIATHVRISDNFLPPLVLGVLLWGGLFLRDQRLRELLPLRKDPET